MNEKKVRAIRILLKTRTRREVAKMFHVSKSAIGLIARRERWGWLTPIA